MTLVSKLGGVRSMFRLLPFVIRNRANRVLKRPSSPKLVSAALTWRCNSRCSTCGIWRSPSLKKQDEVTPDVYRDHILRDPLAQQLTTFEMTGGEVSLYDGLFELTDMAFKYLPKQTQIRIGTNGIETQTLWDYVYRFREQPLYLSLSIDGVGEVHDKIRGVSGNFHAVLSLIRYIRILQDSGSPIKFGASVCVSKLNLAHIPTLTTWLESERIPFQLTPVIFPKYAQQYYARVQRKDLDFLTVDERADAIALFSKYDKLTYSLFCDFWANKPYPIAPCYALREYVHLRPEGLAKTCMWGDHIIGSFVTNTLTEIWTSKSTEALRDTIHSCIACNRAHPNLCDSLNNFHFHGTLAVKRIRRRLTQ